MNQEQSIYLWIEGKDAWNEWSRKMRVQQIKLKKANEWWETDPESDNITDKALNWLKESHVDFSNVRFENSAAHFKTNKYQVLEFNFVGYEFSSEVTFSNAEFNQSLIFSRSKFYGITSFRRAIFKGFCDFQDVRFGSSVSFQYAKFEQRVIFAATFFGETANFSSATFEDTVNFTSKLPDTRTTFVGAAYFKLAEFKRPVFFHDAAFNADADFTAIISERSFILSKTTFTRVPDFTEAAFHSPPALDGMKVDFSVTHRKTENEVVTGNDQKASDPRPKFLRIFKLANNPLDHQKFRAIGKMATDGNDHQRAMDAFANELRCRRFWEDKPFSKNSGRFWLGLIYRVCSDFGRGFIQPFIGWALTTIMFASIYAGLASSVKWEWMSAMYISFRHGLIFSGLTRSYSWDNAMHMLFDKSGQLEIPISISWAMAFQPLFSAIFIFLFFLALRNQFKIR